MIDTHTHLYLDDYNPDKCAAVDRAFVAGVEMMIFPGVDAGSLPQIRQLHALRPQCTAMCAGLHPTEVDAATWREHLAEVETALTTAPDAKEFVAVGEIGLDLYWEKDKLDLQLEVLDAQLNLADRVGLPVILHCREALPQMLDMMRAHAGRQPQAVFHCFGGTDDDIAAIRQVQPDAMFGIGGIVTFKKSPLPAVLSTIGLNHIMLETDAPWLAPVPMRGKQNESSYLPYIAERIATELGITTEEVDKTTTANARRFFRL
jgi:TatD DNase family protein